MGPFQSFEDIKDMLRRRLWVVLLVAVVGSMLSLFMASQRQHLYRSSEIIQIAQPQIADDLAGSTVEGSSARRLQLIEQRLMSRSSVLKIIEQYDLYRDVGDRSPSNLVYMLRSSVRIEGVAAAQEGFGNDGTISILTITAEMPTAQQAQQIAHEFAQRTIELSHRERLEQAKETLTFIARQEGALAQELASLEDEIAAYRAENNLALSTNLEFRSGELATLNGGLLDIARERIEIQRGMQRATETQRPATARRMQDEFEEQLETLDAQRELLLERKAELEDLLKTSPEVQSRLDAYDRQLEQVRDQLSVMRSRRTEAEIGFRLEMARQSERLTVLEPAPLPDYPFTKSRKAMAVAGGLASLLAGLALAVLLELRDPVLRTAHRMELQTGLKPVVAIPAVKKGRSSKGMFARLFRRRDRFTSV
ncbi:MAG: DUF874 domain-containing protein [Rhodobacteraceae bacterium]|nr:DUF874 domain-containing protein [Paracoccaceae bacterium]